MFGLQPPVQLAPLEYRCALDGAMTVLQGGAGPIVRNNLPELANELRWRLMDEEEPPRGNVLWIEPLAVSWFSELREIAGMLRPGGRLAVIASSPLARLVPERRDWCARALGMRPDGLGRLRRALVRAGLTLTGRYSFHTIDAVLLSVLSAQAERLGRPALADRLHFAARLRYTAAGRRLGTVTLLTAESSGGRDQHAA